MKATAVSSVGSVKSRGLSYAQRLALVVHSAASSRMDGKNVQFPYGFERYARVAASCRGRKLEKHAMFLGGAN